MERVNLNLPRDARDTLKRLAKRAGMREAECARELLLKAIEDQTRQEFFEQVAASQNPASRTRLLEIAAEMDRLCGQKG